MLSALRFARAAASDDREELLRAAVLKVDSWRGLKGLLGHNIEGSNASVRKACERFRIDTSHFKHVPKPLTDDQKAYILHCRNNARIVARQLGVPIPAVTSYRAKHGQPPSPLQKLTDEQVAEIRARSDQGWLGVDLAEEYGVSEALISRLLSRQRRASQ